MRASAGNRFVQKYLTQQATLKDYRGKYKLTFHKEPIKVKGFDSENYSRGGKNTEKLDQNVARARSKIFEYGMCNDWDWFVTLTLDPARYNRHDLKSYHKDLSSWIHDSVNKRLHIKMRWLLIPEMHKDGAWHMHGFIAGLPPNEITKNEHGYWDWQEYRDKFGWISLDRIRDQERCARYITKYVKKDLSDRRDELNAHLYYCSRGLQTATEIKRGTISRDDTIPADFENDHVKVKWSKNLYELAQLFD